MVRLLRYGETVVTMSVRESYFDTNHTFGSEDGIAFAFAITAYDGDRSVTEDPDYGTVKAKIVSWGIEKDEQGLAGGELETHLCTRQELGLDGLKSDKLYPIRDNSYRDIETYSEKLRCIDSDFTLQGDYSSSKAQVLKLSLEMCDRSVVNNTCKSEEETAAWLRRKFLVVQ